MRLLTSELLKVWTAPRTVVGLVLAELVLVAIGTASTIDSALSSGEGLPQGVGSATGTLPPHLEEDLISVSASNISATAGPTHHSPGDVALLDTLGGWAVHAPGHPGEVDGPLTRPESFRFF